MQRTTRRARALGAVGTALVLAASLVLAPAAGAAPKSKVPLAATVVSGSSATVRYDDPAPGQVLFDQTNHLVVEGSFGGKPLQGTLDYTVRVLLPGTGAAAQFLDATTQSATFTSNQGDLTSETSWYAIPVIGFECLEADPVACLDHNAVVLGFGAGTGSFSNLRVNALWTMRVAHTSADGAVTDGAMTGGAGLGFKYCHTGQATTVESPGAGTYRTSTSLMMTSAACSDENGNLIPKDTVPGGAMSLEYGYSWDITPTADDPVVTLYPGLSAAVWSAAGRMVGVVAEVHMGAIPPGATGDTLMLGGPYGELTGLYASYQYALVRSWNVVDDPDVGFPLGMRIFNDYSATVGILAVY